MRMDEALDEPPSGWAYNLQMALHVTVMISMVLVIFQCGCCEEKKKTRYRDAHASLTWQTAAEDAKVPPPSESGDEEDPENETTKQSFTATSMSAMADIPTQSPSQASGLGKRIFAAKERADNERRGKPKKVGKQMRQKPNHIRHVCGKMVSRSSLSPTVSGSNVMCNEVDEQSRTAKECPTGQLPIDHRARNAMKFPMRPAATNRYDLSPRVHYFEVEAPANYYRRIPRVLASHPPTARNFKLTTAKVEDTQDGTILTAERPPSPPTEMHSVSAKPVTTATAGDKVEPSVSCHTSDPSVSVHPLQL